MTIKASVDIGLESLGAIEAAAVACGRLGATVDSSPAGASHVLLARHSVRAFGLNVDALAGLLLGGSDSNAPATVPDRSHPDLVAVVDRAGLGVALTESTRAALFQADAEGEHDSMPRQGPRSSSLLRAAVAAGTICSASPASREAQRASALVSAVVLTHGGVLPAPWVAPWELDAQSRAAAVQIDRSGAWAEWVRTWCLLFAREAAGAEAALRRATRRMEGERESVAAQPRVGATDLAVLGYLQGNITFTIRDAAAALGLTRPTVGTSIERLNAAGVAVELTGQLRDRIWTSAAWAELATGR